MYLVLTVLYLVPTVLYSLNIGLQGWDLAAEEGQGPEIFGDVNGEPPNCLIHADCLLHTVLTVLLVLTV